ncbi:MAG: hypothetical protein Ct9H300mP3_11460 [Gammaproteobacteria bacterium]|nr:MAG: hypothetical protein Ct9H300mP3_11460 [Gammaproteobacteria bacterium]
MTGMEKRFLQLAIELEALLFGEFILSQVGKVFISLTLLHF